MTYRIKRSTSMVRVAFDKVLSWFGYMAFNKEEIKYLQDNMDKISNFELDVERLLYHCVHQKEKVYVRNIINHLRPDTKEEIKDEIVDKIHKVLRGF